MTKSYYVFNLQGPMSSWGGPAIVEHRPTDSHPTKSAVLGLVAACLGVDRADEDAHQDLHRMKFAVVTEHHGSPMVDFHTSQNPEQAALKKKMFVRSRRDELDVPSDRLNTMLSKREYLCDASFTVILEYQDKMKWTAVQFIDALQKPVYTPFLGRKSCPLSVMMNPRLVEADSVLKAYQKATSLDKHAFKAPAKKVLHWEEGMISGLAPVHRTNRVDAVVSRVRNQFGVRGENISYIG